MISKKNIFIGDSITEFWENENPTFFVNNSIINKGISGQTTIEIANRFNNDVVLLKPEKVIILAGINDIAENSGPISLEQIMENIISMSDLALANNIRVVLCSVLPANKFYWHPKIKPADKVIQLNQMIFTFAKNNNLTYVDYYSSMVDDKKGLLKKYGNDGVHPNLNGYQKMEEIILPFLK